MIEWIMLFWFIILGCCIGSFLNVVILRLPLGKEFVKEPSHCPVCKHPLAWYDNIPLISWLLLLRGKCRYCKTPISAQYPLIEALTGVIFGLVFWMCYFSGKWQVFSTQGFAETWPVYLCLIVGFAALIVITVIDLKLYVVDIRVPVWTVFFLLLAYPAIAMLFPGTTQTLTLPPHVPDFTNVSQRLLMVEPQGFHDDYRVMAEVESDPPLRFRDIMEGVVLKQVTIGSVPITGITGVGIGLGGALGLVLSYLLLRLKLIPRTLTDEELLKKAEEKEKKAGKLKPAEKSADSKEKDKEAQLELHEDPHAYIGSLGNMRLEVLKELLFCVPILLGMILGAFFITVHAIDGFPPVLQRGVMTLGAVLLGIMVGGGMIWATRIIGTLAFGREAMGMGDTYIMALIGAFCGWELTVMAFFLAPISGLLYAMVVALLQSFTKKSFKVLPYGPHLSIGALLVWVIGPWLLGFFAPRVAVLLETMPS